jgi:UDP-glucuronate decarboxylase
VQLIYDIPLAELIYDFFDKLKSSTRGYGTLNYDISDFKEADLVKLRILVNGKEVDALTSIVHKDQAEFRGRQAIKKMRKEIPRHLFEIALQAAETGHVVVATLHTSSAAQTVQRFLKLIPSERLESAQASLADSLRLIMCQRLMLDDKRFELMRHDVTWPLYVEVDEIYNLACPASPIHYQFDPVQTTKTSVHGAINMLGLAKRVKAKIFQASTSEVYGDPEIHPQPESYRGSVNPIGPRACYDEGKRCAETLFFDYHRQHKLRIKVARIFNTYGPRMHPNDGRVVSNFIVQALKGEPITIYGDGQQTRSFCYVDDLVEGFVRLMDTPDEVTGPMNLGNPGEFTIRELAEKVIEMTGSRSEMVRKPLPADDPMQRQPDISFARRTIGWEPKVQLEAGLARTIAYFDALLRAETSPRAAAAVKRSATRRAAPRPARGKRAR